MSRKIAYPNPKQRLTNPDGTPLGWYAVDNGELKSGDMLNFDFSVKAFGDPAPRRLLEGWTGARSLPEYVSRMFPFSYTAGTADFVLAYRRTASGPK